jgi:hypothetical protein
LADEKRLGRDGKMRSTTRTPRSAASITSADIRQEAPDDDLPVREIEADEESPAFDKIRFGLEEALKYAKADIAENLHRADLTVLERSEHVAEWVRLCDKRNKPSQVETVSIKGGRGKEGGATCTEIRQASRAA